MRRSGFTLLELLLVMVVIVAAGALTMPLVDSMLHPNQVSASVDAVRTQLEEARGRAMDEGRPYRFSYMESTGKFRIEPDDQDVNPDTGFVIDGQLPEPCLFVESGAGPLDASMTPSESGAWKTAVVFLPDGTARDDAEVNFGRAGLMRATLKLRALTGSVTQVKEAPR